MFAAAVIAHWLPAVSTDARPGRAVVLVDPTPADDRSVSLLDVLDGPSVLTVTPRQAGALAVEHHDHLDRAHLLELLRRSGLTLGDPDHVFHLPVARRPALLDEAVPTGTRRLLLRDAPALARLTAEAPEEEVDEAFVEIDHWLAFGGFVDGELACAGSMYPWGDSALADVGVITLPRFRGRGLGRATVRAMSAAAIRRGREPQYRCRVDNTASIALAVSAGFARFGDWRVIAPASGV